LEINFSINGEQKVVELEYDLRLVDLLRQKFGLIGTKEGCGKGECGACTVLINSLAVNSCLVMASQVEGAEIITIEGISNGEKLDVLQQAFIDQGAVQCGFCTPGLVISLKALFIQNPHPDRLEVATAISGNLCRCTGYQRVMEAAEQVKG